jgi:hypothetical protein
MLNFILITLFVLFIIRPMFKGTRITRNYELKDIQVSNRHSGALDRSRDRMGW